MSAAIINPEFVERYQLELEKNPQSKVFAPLAEAYRKMGLLEEAHRLCKKGVQFHPDFAGGRVAFAKVLLALQTNEEALTQLEKAVQLSPDNLLAHSLMGEALLELRRPKEALKAFKMVLFLNPDDEKARETVRKWEFLTADEFEDDAFQMRPVFGGNSTGDSNKSRSEDSSDKSPDESPRANRQERELERALSLADAFTVRNDLTAATEVLENARHWLGPLPEIDTRLQLLSRRAQALATDEPPDELDELDALDEPNPAQERRRQVLEDLLRRINERRARS